MRPAIVAYEIYHPAPDECAALISWSAAVGGSLPSLAAGFEPAGVRLLARESESPGRFELCRELSWQADGAGPLPQSDAVLEGACAVWRRQKTAAPLDCASRSLWSVAHVDPAGYEPDVLSVFNAYSSATGNHRRVLAHRIHASEVRLALGFRCGRVLQRIAMPDGQDEGAPHVLWQMDYPGQDDRRTESEAVMSTPEFKAVMATMRTLVRAFARTLWHAPGDRTGGGPGQLR